MKKIMAKVLLGLSAALCVAFAVITCVAYNIYSQTINSAPFIVGVALNALYFIAPAAALAAVALFLMRKTKALAVCAISFGALTAGFIGYYLIAYGQGGRIEDMLLDSLLLAIPLIFSGIVFLIFMLISRYSQKKALSDKC